jgi:hypothetical protein
MLAYRRGSPHVGRAPAEKARIELVDAGTSIEAETASAKCGSKRLLLGMFSKAREVYPPPNLPLDMQFYTSDRGASTEIRELAEQ